MRLLFRNIPIIVLFLFISLSLVFAAQSSAQENTSTNSDQQTEATSTSEEDAPESNSNNAESNEGSEDVEGIDIETTANKEVYYWDKEDDEVVLVGAGGLYNDKVIFKKDPKSIGGNYDTYTTTDEEPTLQITGWLPLRLREMEFSEDSQESCGLSEKIPLMAKGGYKSDFTVNVSKIDGSAYIDIIGDSSEDWINGFIFSWFIAVPEGEGGGSVMASAPYDVVDGAAIISSQTKKANLRPYVEKNGHKAVEDINAGLQTTVDEFSLSIPGVWVDYTYDYHECKMTFKDHFNTSLAKYNPQSIDHSVVNGRILGEKGMKFTEWVRRTDNIREYLAIESSARQVTKSHCETGGFKHSNLCQTTLSKDFHKCYMRAIGYKPSNTQHYSFENIKDFEYFKVNTLKHEPWMHSVRVNTDAFVSCFALGSNAKNTIGIPLKSLEEPTFFRSNDDSKQFALEIVNNTQWPMSINPIFAEADDVENPPITTKCSLGSLGWILCPTMKFFAKISDNLFRFLEDWMKMPPLREGPDEAAHKAWGYLRDFGNILFSVILLSLILTQAAGGVLSSYTMRKMMPRIVVTAVLVNVSFILTSSAIDISNIVGSSITTVIHEFSSPKSEVEGFSNWESIVTSVAYAGGAAAGTFAVLTSLAALLPMLITAVFSMVIVLVILLLRQSLVIILVVLSPVAIAMRLLPGTEKWFKKWKDLFIQMIMLYPAIALVFAGSYFASTIIVSSATEQGGLEGSLLAIFGLAIQVLPLFITPIVMKLGGSTLNSFGGTLKSKMSGAQSASINAAKKTSENISDRLNTRALQGKGGVFTNRRRKKVLKKFEKSFVQREAERSKMKGVADTKLGRFAAGVSGGGVFDPAEREKIDAALSAEAAKLSNENIKAAKLKIDNDDDLLNAPDIAAQNAMHLSKINDKSTDESERIARMQSIVESDDLDAINTLIDRLSSMTDEERRRFAELISNSPIGNSAAHLAHPEAIEAIKTGSATVGGLHQAAYRRGDYSSAEGASKQSAASIASMSRHLNADQLATFGRAHDQAVQSDKYSQNISPSATSERKRLP